MIHLELKRKRLTQDTWILCEFTDDLYRFKHGTFRGSVNVAAGKIKERMMQMKVERVEFQWTAPKEIGLHLGSFMDQRAKRDEVVCEGRR